MQTDTDRAKFRELPVEPWVQYDFFENNKQIFGKDVKNIF